VFLLLRKSFGVPARKCAETFQRSATENIFFLAPSVIHNSNYVIMVSNLNCLKHLCVFSCFIIRCTETFWSPCTFLWSFILVPGCGLPLRGFAIAPIGHTTVCRTPLRRVISPMQRPLPDNTQHSQETDTNVPGRIRTHNLSKRAAADLPTP
jgi:hypothetical protein